MSTPRRNDQVIADRLTRDRLRSYLASTPTLSAAIDLYDWNVSIAGALHEDLGRVEVVLRNAMDFALTQHAARTDGCRLVRSFGTVSGEAWSTNTRRHRQREAARRCAHAEPTTRIGHHRADIRILAVPLHAGPSDVVVGASPCCGVLPS